jgi:hypothetical protein
LPSPIIFPSKIRAICGQKIRPFFNLVAAVLPHPPFEINALPKIRASSVFNPWRN